MSQIKRISSTDSGFTEALKKIRELENDVVKNITKTTCKKLSGEMYETNRGYCLSTERVVMENNIAKSTTATKKKTSDFCELYPDASTCTNDIRTKELEDFAERYCGKYTAVNTDLGIKCSNKLHGAKIATKIAKSVKNSSLEDQLTAYGKKYCFK